MDPHAQARRAQGLVREFVPAYVSRLPRDAPEGVPTLQSLLEAAPVNLWWFLEIAEKSPLRGRWVNQLYFLALLRLFVEGGGLHGVEEVWLDLDDGVLAAVLACGLEVPCTVREFSSARRRSIRLHHRLASSAVVRYPLHAVGTWALHFLRAVSLVLVGAGPAVLPRGAVGFFSFYPAWWSQPFEPTATERFFEDLPDRVAARAPVRFLLWFTGSPSQLVERRAAVRRLAGGQAVFLQAVLGPLGAWPVLDPRHLLRIIRFHIGIGRRLRAEFAGFDIGRIICDEVIRSLTSPEFFLDLLLCRAVDRIVGAGGLRGLIYRLEFQPFEKAVLAGVRGRVPTVAVQHSTFGHNYLPYFFPSGELGDGGTPPMPLPQVIATAGPLGRDIMVRNGFPPERVEITGPVRYRRLLLQRARRPSRAEARAGLRMPRDGPAFLVTTSVVRDESLALLAAIAQALGVLRPQPYMLFKSHPAMRLDDVFEAWVGPALPDGAYRILSPDAAMPEFLPAADGVVLTGTTVAVEAMLFDVVPVVFESRVLFDAKAMDFLEEACLTVTDSDGLAQVLRWIITRDPRVEAVRRQWRETIARLFGETDRDPHERFVEILARHGIVR